MRATWDITLSVPSERPDSVDLMVRVVRRRRPTPVRS